MMTTRLSNRLPALEKWTGADAQELLPEQHFTELGRASTKHLSSGS